MKKIILVLVCWLNAPFGSAETFADFRREYECDQAAMNHFIAQSYDDRMDQIGGFSYQALNQRVNQIRSIGVLDGAVAKTATILRRFQRT